MTFRLRLLGLPNHLFCEPTPGAQVFRTGLECRAEEHLCAVKAVPGLIVHMNIIIFANLAVLYPPMFALKVI